MAHFLCRLIPPRPTFLQDMSEQEQATMGEHVGYWTQLAEAGTAVVFGPVADPAGAWGVGILQVDDREAVHRIEASDPAIKASVGFRYEVLDMPMGVVLGARSGS